MKDTAPGQASWTRISTDNTRASKPTAMAVMEYCSAMIFASWENTYLPSQVLG